MVPPVDPAEGGEFDVVDGPPGALHGDQFGFVERVDRLGHGVVVGVALGPDRGDGAFSGEAFAVADGEILDAAVGVMHEPAEVVVRAGPDRHFQGAQREVRAEGGRGSPADDPSREHVGHERGVREPGPCRDVGDVRDPQLVWCGGPELALHPISRPGSDISRHGRASPTAADPTGEAVGGHEPFDGAAGHGDAFTVELPPDLAGTVDLIVLVEHPPDLHDQFAIAEPATTRPTVLGRVVGGRGDLQHRADRLDPEHLPIGVDVGDYLRGCGSSSRAKKAAADFKISFARRNSRFSRSSSTRRDFSDVDTPGFTP